MINVGDTIVIQPHAQYRGVLLGLMQQLKAERRVRLRLVVSTDQELQHYQGLNGDGLFDSLTRISPYEKLRLGRTSDAAEVIAQAQANEKWLGVTYNQLAMSDRHFGRGYALGGFHQPRSRMSEETSYVDVLRAFNHSIRLWREELENSRPALVITWRKLACVVCRRIGIPIRLLAVSRYKNYHYWAIDEFLQNPRIAEYYRTEDRAPTGFDVSEPYDIHIRVRAKLQQRARLPSLIKEMATIATRRSYWRLRGFEKGRGYYFIDEMRYLFRSWRDGKRMTGDSCLPLAALDGQRFVFYPLHTEPEVALQTLSPEYFYQLPCIAAVARDLPAGTILAVKETPIAIGRRPPKFYDQIREFKNVVLLNMMELGPEVVRRAAAVVTITGTAGFEAAVMGKPVVTFGRNNLYNILPHVRVVTDETQLRGHLNDMLDPDFDRACAQRNGARFLAAVLAASFDMSGFSILSPDVADNRVVGAAFDALLESAALSA